MASDIPILSMASAMARHAAARHSVIAENIANADTPGYRARDVQPFGEKMAAAAANAAQAYGATEARGRIDTMITRSVGELGSAESNPNGNTVSLEDQMMRSAQAQSQHEAALGLYRKSLELMRMTLGRR